jgi:hypothetical protein
MKPSLKKIFAGGLVAVAVIILLCSIPCCTPAKIDQGEITFEITYPYNPDLSNTMKMILPKEATLIFKGSKMLTIVKTGKIFKTEIYADEAAKDLEMRLDFGSDVFYTKLTSADQEKFKNSLPNYTITPTAEADSVNGMWGKKYTVKYDSDTIPEFESWFSEDITLQNISWFSNYAGIVGVPIIYDIDQYGIRMHFEITGFKKREVKDEEFTRDPGLEEIKYDAYDKKLKDLFDILTGS